jgi:signal peptidase I
MRCFCYIPGSVSESVHIPDSASVGDSAPARSSGETKRHLLAALFSALVPGAGQLFLGQRRKGIVLLLIFSALLAGFWPLRLLRFYAGLVVLYCGWIVLYFYAACDAQLSRNRQTSFRTARWWLVVTLPVTALTLHFLGMGATRASGFRTFKVPSPSMERTILNGDQIVADMHYYSSRSPDREEIVIFEREGVFFVKRVIAVAGDTIQGMSGEVFVNGQRSIEPYVQHTSSLPLTWMVTFGPIVVPNGKCFVMGDNRDVSLDSRSPDFGPVDESSIVGKALYVFNSDRPGRSFR